MTPQHISWRVVADRFDLIDSLLEKTERLPLVSLEDFVAMTAMYRLLNQIYAAHWKR